MKKISFLFGVLLLLGQGVGYGQNYSNKGKDFYITYPAHIDGNLSVLGVYITSDVNATGTITVGTQTLSFSVTANNVTTKFIGGTTCASCAASSTSVYLSQDEGITTNGAVHVVSDNPVVVYAHIIRSARSGATLVLPTTVWGKQYIVPSYKNVGTQTGGNFGYGTITVVAAEANTTVQITPTVDTKNNAHPALTPYTITLVNPGDVYQVQFKQSQDISGTTVQSFTSGTGGCKKIAVFSSTTWSAFGCNGASSGDNLYQQLFPTGAWGKNFLTAPAKTRLSDIFRVFVTDPSTVVTKTENGITSTLTGLVNNSYYEYTTGSPTFIQSDKPSSVVQYLTTMSCQTGANLGDPEMIVLNPVEQTINNITVFSAHQNFVPPGQSAVTNCYLNIIIPTNASGSFKINGAKPASSFIAIPGTSFSYLQEEVTATAKTNPVQTLAADSSFSAIAYGFGNVESYGYNAGTNVKDFTQVASFQNPFLRIDSAVTCANTNVQFGIPLNFQPTSIKWDYSGAPGINPKTTIGPIANPVYDSIRNLNGQSLYYYSPKQTYTFANGNTSIQRDTIKLYTTSATPDGCGSTEQLYTIPVVVRDVPASAKFSVTHFGCISDSAKFTDLTPNANNLISRWIWDFGDGTKADLTSSTVSPKLYNAVGSYTIKLKVANEIGCASDSDTHVITISSKPVANFVKPAVACMNDTVTFTDASTIQQGTIGKWIWNLDKSSGVVDTVSTNAPQSFAYDTYGTKDVRLVVQSTTGCNSDTFRVNPAFKVTARPVPGFIIPEVCLNDASALFQDTTKIADGSAMTYLWNFNASIPAVTPGPTFTPASTTTASPSVKYNKSANYKVSVTITANGCVASLSSDFTVNGSNPVPLFEVQKPTGLCSNDSVRIKNQSTVDFGNVTRLEIFWDANDLTRKTTDEDPFINKLYAFKYPDFQFPSTKTYTVTLKAYSGNAASCSKSVTQTITVNASPKVSFVTMPGICNEANARQITQATFDNRVPGTFSYSGTGVNATGLFNPQTAGVGTFPILYQYTSNKSCVDTATKNITVWPTPVAVWTVVGNICQKNDILFTDSSQAKFSKITQRIWNYDDGTALVTRTNDSTFTRKFATSKTYNISLQVKTDSGCVSTLNTQPIKVNYLPVPAFSLPSICLPDGRGQFLNQSTIPDGSEALFSYLWNFNDPNDPSSSTLKEPTHKYIALGPYAVKLKITTKDGCVDSLTRSLITVYPQPKADFSITPAIVCLGDTIRFKDLGNGITSNGVSWNWDLANGNSSVLQNPSKQFNDSGTFNISYYFFNGQGCVSDTVVKSVTVYPYPVLVLGPMIKILEGGQAVIKPKLVYGTGLTYQWTPSLYLSSDTAARPITKPADDITYKLVLTGTPGCSVSDTIFVQVLKAPEVPNAFSPNGDGINDTWRIKYLESYPGAEIDVFNRYGQKVFHSIGYDTDWDGKINGKPLPIGTYYYIINPKNGRQTYQGSITIIK